MYFAANADVMQLLGRDFPVFALIVLLYRFLKWEFVGWNPDAVPFIYKLDEFPFFRKGKGKYAELVFRTKRICAALIEADVFLMLVICGICGYRTINRVSN